MMDINKVYKNIDRQKSALDLMQEDLERHKVTVLLPGEDVDGPNKTRRGMYLIMIKAKTSTIKDFEKTFGEILNSTQKKIAKKVFGEKETDNDYGVFVDGLMNMVFAFNRKFADYDSKRERIIYLDPDDILLGEVDGPMGPYIFSPSRPSGGGHGVIRYSLTEKEEVGDEKKEA